MTKGFIYVVSTVTKDYVQGEFYHVPTEWGDRIYFGPCKEFMRPKMHEGDWVFGLSRKVGPIRPIVFVAQIEERITFAEAYDCFPQLRGPEGPIHVKPISGRGPFPFNSYEHIPGGNHADKWQRDFAKQLDAFFVFVKRDGWQGRWLGRYGPTIDNAILGFLKKCSVHGSAGLLNSKNRDATLDKPIAYGGLYRGLHLETDDAESLLALCDQQMSQAPSLNSVITPARGATVAGDCHPSTHTSQTLPKQTAHVAKRKC